MAFKPLKPAVEDQKNASSPNPGAEESDEYSSDDSESQEPVGDSEAKEEEPLPTTFSELGVIDPICEACSNLGFKAPTPIQAKAIPAALNHVDVIGLAQTGSGKTAAFSIPVLQALWEAPQELFACVLAPTRELAYQTAEQIEALGSQIQVRTATLVGGMDMMQQSIALSKKPHVVIATPGRLQDHLENTKGFNLRKLKYLVLDEADRLLDLDFGPIIDRLLASLPRQRTTMMFSATMTTKVARLQRASLHKPVRVDIKGDQRTADNLTQYYLFMPHERKEVYLVWLANENAAASMIMFTRTVADAQRLATLLRILGFGAIPLHGSMPQDARLAALQRFRGGSAGAAGGPRILVATDVAARGLDIPAVDMVVNYDLPGNSKDYIHRVGRTARAGRSGKAVSLVSQYDVEILQRIEAAIGVRLSLYPGGNDTDAILMLAERVAEAGRRAKLDLKEQAMAGGGKKRKPRESKWDAMDRDEDSRGSESKPLRGKAKPKGKKIRQR